MTSNRPAWLLMMAGWLGGVGASVVLLFASLSSGSLPPGCGPGGGCAEVLASRWSNIFGLPVSLAAVAVYAAAFTAGVALVRRPRSQKARLVLAASIGAVVFSALWFSVVQALIIRAACPWCIAAHVFGAGFSLGALFWMRRGEAGEIRRASGVAIGLVIGVVFAGAQIALPGKPPGIRVIHGPGGAAGDAWPAMISQAVSPRLPTNGLPRLGADAPQRRLYVLFDYACPHCRELHKQLHELLHDDPGLAVYLLPAPLHPDCNPHLSGEIASRFAESCDLATLALGVWLAAPERFEEFDAWLFASDSPRASAEARARAMAATDQPLDERTDEIAALLETGTAVYGAAGQRGADRLPILILDDDSLVTGRFDSVEALREIVRAGGPSVARE